MDQEQRNKAADLIRDSKESFYLIYISDKRMGRMCINASVEFLATAHARMGAEIYQHINVTEKVKRETGQDI